MRLCRATALTTSALPTELSSTRATCRRSIALLIGSPWSGGYATTITPASGGGSLLALQLSTQ